MKLVYVLRCDGRREYISQAVISAQDKLKANFDHMFIVNDSGDQDYAFWLEVQFGEQYTYIHHPERLGMAAGWRTACDAILNSGADYAFCTEDDFVFHKKINVKKMAQLLHCEPHLAQLVLKRNPWSDEEKQAGGQIETAPEEYEDHSCPNGEWVENSHIFSFNPSLVRADAIRTAMDNPGDGLERGFTDALTAAGYRFGYFGTKVDPPRTQHIGEIRSSGYRW